MHSTNKTGPIRILFQTGPKKISFQIINLPGDLYRLRHKD